MSVKGRDISVAIVGLGRVGTVFMRKLFDCQDKGIKLVAVAEAEADDVSTGLRAAKEIGIQVFTDGKDIIQMGSAVDIIFDLTNDRHSKMDLRISLAKSGNMHTVIAPEVLAYFIWNLIASGEQFPAPDPLSG